MPPLRAACHCPCDRRTALPVRRRETAAPSGRRGIARCPRPLPFLSPATAPDQRDDLCTDEQPGIPPPLRPADDSAGALFRLSAVGRDQLGPERAANDFVPSESTSRSKLVCSPRSGRRGLRGAPSPARPRVGVRPLRVLEDASGGCLHSLLSGRLRPDFGGNRAPEAGCRPTPRDGRQHPKPQLNLYRSP